MSGKLLAATRAAFEITLNYNCFFFLVWGLTLKIEREFVGRVAEINQMEVESNLSDVDLKKYTEVNFV